MYDKIYYVVHLVQFYGTYKNIHTVSVNNKYIRFFLLSKFRKVTNPFSESFFFQL